MLEALAEAGMERCLVLGGDRDTPAGSLNSSLQILETGLIQKRGVKTIRIGCYPEGHPKIPEAVLDKARADKLAIAERDGLDVTIVSQFLFEAEPIVGFAKKLLEGWVNLRGNRLTVRTWTEFTDFSGRSNYETTDYFVPIR